MDHNHRGRKDIKIHVTHDKTEALKDQMIYKTQNRTARTRKRTQIFRVLWGKVSCGENMKTTIIF